MDVPIDLNKPGFTWNFASVKKYTYIINTGEPEVRRCWETEQFTKEANPAMPAAPPSGESATKRAIDLSGFVLRLRLSSDL